MNQRVYVSYAPTDGSVATQLVAALAVDPILQAWAPPTRQGDDATEVGLRRSIEAADTLIVVITAEALGSPLCELEVSTAVQCNVPVVAAVAGELTGLEPPDWLGNFPMADIRSGDCRDLVAILRKFQPAMASAIGVGTAPEGFQAAPTEDASRPLTAEDLNVFIPVEVVDTPEPRGPVGSSYQSYRTAFEPGANAAGPAEAPPPPWVRSRPEPRFVETKSARDKIHTACTWLFVFGFLDAVFGGLVLYLRNELDLNDAYLYAGIGQLIVAAVYFMAAIIGARGSEALFHIVFGLIVINVVSTFVLSGIGAGLGGLLINFFFARAMRRGAQGAAELKLARANPALTRM